MDTAIFSPLMADFLLILVMVLGVGSLVASAYVGSLLIGHRKDFKKIAELEQEIVELKQTIKNLPMPKANVPATPVVAEPKPTATVVEKMPPEPLKAPEERPIWANFIIDYNSLAVSMNVPKADEACAAFVDNYKLDLLICTKVMGQNGAPPELKFSAVKTMAESDFWAWSLPNSQGKEYIVVPNPWHSYNQELHNEHGLKEVFASNYETGEYKNIQIKLPAQFTKPQGTWKVAEPGLIKLK